MNVKDIRIHNSTCKRRLPQYQAAFINSEADVRSLGGRIAGDLKEKLDPMRIVERGKDEEVADLKKLGQESKQSRSKPRGPKGSRTWSMRRMADGEDSKTVHAAYCHIV